MKVYVVIMYRWGDREKHSYLLGVYSTIEIADEESVKEQIYRGGRKYQPEILEVEIDEEKIGKSTYKTILALKNEEPPQGRKE